MTGKDKEAPNEVCGPHVIRQLTSRQATVSLRSIVNCNGIMKITGY